MSNAVCADMPSMTVLVGTGNGRQPADEPREIVTAADVEAVLAAPKASFDELVLCVKASRSAQRPDLRHAAAERAFDTAMSVPFPHAGRLVDAALMVRDAALGTARELDEMPAAISEFQDWLDRRSQLLDSDELLKMVTVLSQLQVCLSDSEPPTLIRLSSRLRKVDRSDLAVAVAENAVRAEPDNAAALTTYGAALADVGRCEDAIGALRRAVKLEPQSGHARITLSRALHDAGKRIEALDYAWAAFRADPTSEHAVHRLLASASAVGDTDALEEARTAIAEATGTDAKTDVWLLVISSEALLEVGRIDEATSLLAEASKLPSAGETARRLQRLRTRIAQLKRGGETDPEH
jgi:tetratricopeptide (TPR) repeat protein